MTKETEDIYTYFLERMREIVARGQGFPQLRLDAFLNDARNAYDAICDARAKPPSEVILSLSFQSLERHVETGSAYDGVCDFWESVDLFFYTVIRYDNFEKTDKAVLIPDNHPCPEGIHSECKQEWHSRYPASAATNNSDIVARVSLSVYPHHDWVSILDGFILEGLGEYKFPAKENWPDDNLLNEFMSRTDPVTFYFYMRPNQKTLARIYEAMKPFLKTRQNGNGHPSSTLFPGMICVDHSALTTMEAFFTEITLQCPEAKSFADAGIKRHGNCLKTKVSPGMQMTWERIIALYKEYGSQPGPSLPADQTAGLTPQM